MSIADKLLHLDETKALLRDAINRAGGGITSETPFRSYAGELDYALWVARGGLRSLFDSSETGALASDLPYFVDVDGETEATWGDPVGLIRDASPNRADFTQPTVTARPILGRVPRTGARNLWNRSDDLTVGVSEIDAIITPDEEAGAFRVTASGEGRAIFYKLFAPNRTIVYSIDVKAGSATVVSMDWNASSTKVIFDLVEGSASNSRGTITPLEDGWFRISASMRRDTSSSQGAMLSMPDAAAGDYFFVKNPQVEEVEEGAVEPTPYQQRITSYDITEEGVPSVYYARYDLTDDLISTELPAIENGTLVIAGTNGIWIDDDYNFDGGTFTIGTDTYTGGLERAMSVIGDLIVGGTFVIDRQLTADERDKVVLQLKSMGAPGVIELGPELVVNGDFSDGSNGWSGSAGSNSVSIDTTHNTARLTKVQTGSNYGRAFQEIGFDVGRSYVVSADLLDYDPHDHTPYIELGIGASSSSYIRATSAEVGRISFVWTATVSSAYLRLLTPTTGIGSYVEWDNISVRMELVP